MKIGTETNLSGILENGSQLTVSVIFDENATIEFEVNDYIDVIGTDSENEPNGSSAPITATGIVTSTEDTQINKIQIGAVRSFYEWSDEKRDYIKRENVTDKELQRTTSHEAAHTSGLRPLRALIVEK
ncbi:MAG: hypothetical protein Q4G27_06525 [Flavobacteriaceae bacterium]|nr:hypothetical protein [Flavobacteriaceae bacterium]